MKVESHYTISSLIKMYRNICLVVFCLLATVSSIYCASSLVFVKNERSYESLIGSVVDAPAPPGFVEIIKEILKKYKDSNGASYEELKKFGYGIDQFFSFRLLEKIYEDELSKPAPPTADSNADVVSVPDYTDDATGFVFKDLLVYNFPIFKKGAKSELAHNGLNSASEYQASLNYNVDNTIITGSFYVASSKYFFVYLLKSSSYSVNMRKRRNSVDDSDKFVFIKRSVGFTGEDYVNTYDSSYENSTVINTAFKDALINKVVPYIFSELSQRDAELLKRNVLDKDLQFIKEYKISILDGLTQSALEYVKSYVQNVKNGDDSFTSTDLVFGADKPGAPLPFKQIYSNITLKGFTNFEGKPIRVYDNTSFSDNGRLFNISQGLQFSYSKEGDKTAALSYSFVSGRRTYPKEYKVKSITVISEYLSDLTKKPYQAFRNKEVFFNKAGILFRFEIFDIPEEQQSDSFVFKHLGNDIARVIQESIESTSSSA